MFSSGSVLKIFAYVIYFLDISPQLNHLKKMNEKFYFSFSKSLTPFQMAPWISVSCIYERSFV